MDFSSKRAVVTGGASGIGRAIAQELVTRGARVVVSDVNRDGLQSCVARLGPQGSAFPCNVADHASVEALAEHMRTALGGCDLVFANAGVMASGKFTAMSPAEYDWLMSVNVRGAWSTATVFARLMQEQESGGHICLTGSEHSLGLQHGGASIYTASKHALLGFAEILRAEASSKLKVSIFCPGLIATSLSESVGPESLHNSARNVDLAKQVQARGMSPEEAAPRVLDAIARGDFYIVTHPNSFRAAERRFEEIRAAFEAQAPWSEEDGDRYDVNRVVTDVMRELNPSRPAERS